MQYKAFLTKILKDRLSDLEIVSYFKEDDSYIFTAENSNKPQWIYQTMFGKARWKTEIISNWSQDLELVRQTIGHLTLNTTSQYVKELSQKRILEIDQQNETKK